MASRGVTALTPTLSRSGRGRFFDAFQRVRVGRLEAEVEVEQIPAHFGPGIEVVVEGQAGELAEEVDAVVVAVHRVVEDGVGVGEDVLGGDAVGIAVVKSPCAPLLAVVVVDLAQAPLGDVADPLAVGGVAVEGEALLFVIATYFFSTKSIGMPRYSEIS